MGISQRASLFISIAIFLAGCQTTLTQPEDILSQVLPPDSQAFRNMNTYPGNITCGEYLDVDAMGIPEYRAFILMGEEPNLYPSRHQITIYCSPDPKAAANQLFNIDYNEQQAEIQKIIADFDRLSGPLLQYEKTYFHFPWIEEGGLNALVVPPQSNDPRIIEPDTGFIEAIPNDPWGNDYAYDCEPFAGVRVMYTLQTLGADGAPGGVGRNLDIDLSLIKFFKHIETIDHM